MTYDDFYEGLRLLSFTTRHDCRLSGYTSQQNLKSRQCVARRQSPASPSAEVPSTADVISGHGRLVNASSAEVCIGGSARSQVELATVEVTRYLRPCLSGPVVQCTDFFFWPCAAQEAHSRNRSNTNPHGTLV